MRYYVSARSVTSLLVITTALMALSGCGISTPVPASLPLANGNWQLVATTPTSQLPALSGSISGPSTNVSGLFHVDGSTGCVPDTQAVEVTGWANQHGVINLSGSLAGGTLAIQGVIAADGKSIVYSGYTVTGGACSLAPVYANGQYYSAISGTYTGGIKSSSGMASTLSATFTQSAQPDALGNFTLMGQGTFAANPCFNGSGQITDAQVTGNEFQLTYTDPTTQDSMSIAGQFSPDSSTLTVTKWTTSGKCGSDSGIGQLAKVQQGQ